MELMLFSGLVCFIVVAFLMVSSVTISQTISSIDCNHTVYNNCTVCQPGYFANQSKYSLGKKKIICVSGYMKF